MDDIVQYNKARWEALAQARVVFSQPFLDLTPATARQVVDPQGVMGEVNGKDVLCLASGGGQQSVAFGLLGARVTVFDLTETQLQRDQEAAAHYNLAVQTIQGDMRDLSCFEANSFDLVWHAFSINFIPDPRPVFAEVARIIRPGGLYRIEYTNPFFAGLEERDWTGDGYPLSQPYEDGTELTFKDTVWEIGNEDGAVTRVEGPKEYRHTLSTVVNSLIGHGFVLLGLWEELNQDPQAAPGSWEHLKLIAPPWLTFWFRYRPEVLGKK
jgi:SAM-dependent methyltransferase